MPKVFYGSKQEPGFDLEQSEDLIAVRTRSGRLISRAAGPVPGPLAAELDDSALVVSYPEAGVEVYRIPQGRAARSLSARKSALRASPDVRFAGGVLVDPVSKDPVLYTENIFIKFYDTADADDCQDVIRNAGLSVKSVADYATNAWFIGAPEGTGQKVFEIAEKLLKHPLVEYCHPELIRPRARKQIFPQQWHLRKTTIGGVVVDASASVEPAHEVAQGEGVTIAIIDDGVDVDHMEFSASGKVVAPRDATLRTADPRPKDTFGTGPDGDNHGTACAGVACASGTHGASGVAPKARLMPIRLASNLGSQREAEAFKWAVDNGADVISCSWGPPDGRWWNANDPRHHQTTPIPPSTRLAIDHAVNHGRGGRGCVVLFAAGNGNESADNDGYASYQNVIAVAACNDRGKRSIYSDFGRAVWCAFPSNDFGFPAQGVPEPLTPGIWTTDRLGSAGYNPDEEGNTAGDPTLNYTNSFGGTSSACPGAAGIAALILSINPDLRWTEVRDILRRACEKIDPQGGNYDNTGHSTKYGYGRLNARMAVELAKPAPRSDVTVSRTLDATLPDLQTVKFTLEVAEPTLVESLSVQLDLKHTYIGDLVIRLLPPATTGMGPVVLHNRTGAATKNIKKRYDALNTPALGAIAGRSCKGVWTIEIADKAAQDAGMLVSFGLTLGFAHPDRTVQPAQAAVAGRGKSVRASRKLEKVRS